MNENSEREISYDFSKQFLDPNFATGYRDILINEIKEAEDFITFALHQIFHDKNFQGGRLLDVGCGPTVNRIAAASQFFSEIILSDYSESSRQEVQKWLKNETSEKNWDPLMKLEAQLEGYGNVEKGIQEINSRIRDKVKNVIHCDVLEKEIIPTELGKFDILLTGFCLESACTTPEIYKSVIKNLQKYIQPGGGLVLLSALNAHSYYMKNPDKEFHCLSVSQEFLNEALKEAGFKKRHGFILEHNGDYEEIGEFGGMMALSATKDV